MTTAAALATLVGLVAFATALGMLWRARTGRVRGISDSHTVIAVAELTPDAVAGGGATLLQFSTEVCSPCKTTHSLLALLAAETAGVSHVDVDITRRPDLAARFKLLQSPTTFILDGDGVVRARIGGAPQRADIAAELGRILGQAALAPTLARA